MKRSMTLQVKSAPLLPQSPNAYIPTQTQDEVDNSPPISETLELKDEPHSDDEDGGVEAAFNGNINGSINDQSTSLI